MEFNDLLGDIDPNDVIVFRHRPKEPKLQKILPWLVEDKPDVFNAYQQTQGPKVEKAMLKAKYVASFIGHKAAKALFVGLYKNTGHRPLSFDQFWKIPAQVELNKKYGMRGMEDKCKTCLWFDLVSLDILTEWRGKLVVNWPGQELSWWRWANRNKFEILAITEESIFDRKMPKWNQLTLNWNDLGLIPRKWQEELSRWRGIYFILDENDGKDYVGAAYGEENLLGRWRSYAKSGHGGNKKMKERDPEHFRFSILQILPHDMEKEEVQHIEKTWKDRLHTREFGMNDN